MELDFASIIAAVREGELSEAAIAHLAEQLAASGQRLRLGRANTADLASTGGPGSLATIWAPLHMVARGRTVPKLGVPGRPAGGIDVMAQIPGYLTDLTVDQAERVLDRCGYVHIEAGREFAPADAALFRYRQHHKAQSFPALATASLLAKKLAMGVQRVGLEVRVAAHGNMGTTVDEARANAMRFCRVAALVDVEAVCILTDGNAPQQPYIGRGEALRALELLASGGGCDWLCRHARACEQWADAATGDSGPPTLDCCVVLEANVRAQGGRVEGLSEVVMAIEAGHRRWIVAKREGEVRYDMRAVRDSILTARPSPSTTSPFPDNAGVILLTEPGHTVGRGDPLMTVRCSDAAWPALEVSLGSAISFADDQNAAAAVARAVVEYVRV